MLIAAERSDILDDEIGRYISAGYRLQARGATTAQLVKPKDFSVVAAILGLLFLVVVWGIFGPMGLVFGLFICLITYMSQCDMAVYLSVDVAGVIHVRGDAIPEPKQAH